MLKELKKKIELKKKEIEDFREEQENYDTFDMEKMNELKIELKSLFDQVVKIRNENKWETKKIETPICKKCKKKMVLRKAEAWAYKWKLFFGCSNYPKCHNIVQLKK